MLSPRRRQRQTTLPDEGLEVLAPPSDEGEQKTFFLLLAFFPFFFLFFVLVCFSFRPTSLLFGGTGAKVNEGRWLQNRGEQATHAERRKRGKEGERKNLKQLGEEGRTFSMFKKKKKKKSPFFLFVF